MNEDKFLLLEEELSDLESAATNLRYAIDRTHDLLKQRHWQPEELERLESLASRFARLSDLLIQRIMRLVDDLELVPGGTLLDRIHRAEKRGWVDDAGALVQIRELRNLIAHEYAVDKIAEIYAAVAEHAPGLLVVIPRVIAYANKLKNNYPPRG
jgi:uncharacterized protein YutE (UPF0331/DUF86 family)